ncbi:MAG TPA: RsmE family RNA methyltransferase [Acidimicrobiia bacterium]|nr:RsmE family RNA methyltransferase [Acidimicrobiia bacterium]
MLELSPDQAHHLFRVLRLVDGESVTYTDGQGHKGVGQVKGVRVLRGDEELVPRCPVKLTLAVAPPRDKDRVRFLVEKAAELEVARIVWLQTRLGQGVPPGSARVRSWAQSALEQSQGSYLVDVSGETVYPSQLTEGIVWFTDPGGGTLPAPVPERVTVAVGPEGGWAPDEIPRGVLLLNLGRTILRVETAAILAVGLVTRS